MTGQQSLNTFYQGVKLNNPMLAVMIADDVFTIVIHAFNQDKSVGQAAADRVREKIVGKLPEPLYPVLEGALTELGYS